MTNPVNIPALAHAAHPVVQIENGQAITLSTEVARVFDKRHDHVMRDIQNLCKTLPADHLPNFGETVITRPNPSGGEPIKSPAYFLTRDGFTLLAFGFTGKKAMAFKCAFLKEFNRMEAQLAAPPAQQSLLPSDAQRELQNLVEKLASVNTRAIEQANETSTRMLRANEAMTQAHGLSMRAAYAIAQQVFTATTEDDANIYEDRWVLALRHEGNTLTPKITRITRDAYILPPAKVVDELQHGNLGVTLSNQELSQIAQAALERISRRVNQTTASVALNA